MQELDGAIPAGARGGKPLAAYDEDSTRAAGTVFRLLPFPCLLVEADGTVIGANAAAAVMFHADSDGLVGRDLRGYVVAEKRSAFAAFLAREFSAGGGAAETEFFLGTGEVLPLRLLARKPPRARELWLFAQELKTERALERALGASEERCAGLAGAADRRLAEEVEARARRYEDLLYRASPAGVFRADAAGGYTFANGRWSAVAGLDAAAALGEGWLSAVHEEDRETVAAQWRACVEERRLFRCEYRQAGTRGGAAWVQCQALPDMDAEGLVSGYVGTLLDIGDRRAARAALAAQEERIESLVRERTRELEKARRRTALILDALDEGVCEVDLRGRIGFANLAAAEMLGLRLGALTGTHLHTLIRHEGEGGSLCPPGACPLCDAMRPEGPGKIEGAVFVRSDGRSFPAELGGGPLVVDDLVVGTVVVFRDMTEAREAEAALKESESRFRRAIEGAALPIMVHADDGNIELVNRAWTELTGYDAESLRTTADWARLAYGERSEEVLGEVKALYSLEGGGQNREREITTRDGRKIVWEVSSAMLDRPKEGRRTVITTAVDITERRAAELEAKRQQRLLIQSEKMASLGILVAGMAHEINNPNHAIRLNAGLMARVWDSIRPILDAELSGRDDFLLGGLEYGELREKMPILLKGTIDASEHIDSIVRGLKDFSRSESEGPLQDVRIELVVKAALDLLRSYLSRCSARLVLRLEPDLPPVRARFHKLVQVLINLLQNACQALAPQSQEVGVAGSYDPASRKLRLVVSDGGKGMTEDELAHIRDPFFTTKRGEGGLGLGIPISAAIVEEYGGSLEFESAPARGTRAIVELPVSGQDGEATR